MTPSELVAATLDIYCINLARHPDRWRCSAAEFDRQGLSATRFEAVDGETVEFADLVRAGIVTEAFDQIERRKRGVLGLICSSVALWREIAARGGDKWALICEDDVRFHPRFLELFAAYWSEVPADADIVYGGFQYPWSCDPYDESVLAQISVPAGRHVVRLTRGVNGTHAYALRARTARRLLSEHLPLSTAVDKFPPERLRLYAFKRPPDTDRALVDDLYVDHELWEGQLQVSQHGLISTRAERSTIRHLPYHYLWFARHERNRQNYSRAFEYLMHIKQNPSLYDAVTNDFALWHELIVTAFYVDRNEGVKAFEELIGRSGTEPTRAGLLEHRDHLLDCVGYYQRPDVAARLRAAIARAEAG
jgi:GR25 family glycosyltransferase involved in LPS biosynthesis